MQKLLTKLRCKAGIHLWRTEQPSNFITPAGKFCVHCWKGISYYPLDTYTQAYIDANE